MPRQCVFDSECGPSCRSRQHTYDFNCVITKGSLPEIQAYTRLCYRNGKGKDIFGRTALHIAASCGKIDVVRWLLSVNHSDLRSRDKESGWTALHRAVFYGQLTCARILQHAGAALTVRDREGLTPLDLLHRDGPRLSSSRGGPSDVYSWGDNSNFTLGHGVEKRRAIPEVVDSFRHVNDIIKQVVINKYHSVFLSHSGHVYTCGHGQGGRLGHGDQQTYLIPKLVKLGSSDVVIEIASSVDHTFLLTQRGQIFSFGKNPHHQLGHLLPELQFLQPKKVTGQTWEAEKLTHVATAMYHTVVCTQEAVFTFGLNAGQLGDLYIIGQGHIRGDKYIVNARQVSSLNYYGNRPVAVACSDEATVCYCHSGNVFLLQDYKCIKILQKRNDVVKIRVTGGHLDSSVDPALFKDHVERDLLIVMLLKTGRVLLWRQGYSSPRTCCWLINREVLIKDFDLSSSSMILLSDDSSAFIGHFRGSTVPDQVTTQDVPSSWLRKHPDFLLPTSTEDIHLEPVPCVYRGTSVAIDNKGANFMAIQSSPAMSLTHLPFVSSATISDDLGTFLLNSHAADDICDIIVKVDNRTFAGHKYILSSRSEYFRKVISETQTRDSQLSKHIVHIPDVRADVFEQILCFLYTNTCGWINDGEMIDFPTSATLHLKSARLPPENHNREVCGDFSNAKSPARASNHRRRTQKRSKCAAAPETESETALALESLRHSARRLNLDDLVDRISSIEVKDNRVKVIENFGKNLPPLSFNRKKLHEFCDITIRCDGRHLRRSHRCLLVARLEYFSCMLASDWIETQGTPTVRLPLPPTVIDVILDFCYTDHSSVINDCANVELLCNVLAAADQLLITRLKEMCELAITNLLTLKNVCELLEFASLYRADQLKASCSQFICLNLPVMFEARYIDALSEESLEDLTTFYRDGIGQISRRVITPSMDGPDKEYLERLVSEISADAADADGLVVSPRTNRERKKRRSKRRSPQGARITEGGTVANGAEETRGDERDGLTEVGDVVDDCAGETDESRCEESVEASGDVAGDSCTEKRVERQSQPLWPVRNHGNRMGNGDGLDQDPLSPKPCSLRDIMGEEMVIQAIKDRATKDERNRQAAQRLSGSTNEATEPVETSRTKSTSQNPWSPLGSLTLSFKDLMKDEMKREKKHRRRSSEKSDDRNVSSECVATQEISTSSSSPPAWSVTPTSPGNIDVTFVEILEDERRVMMEIANRKRNKPLHLIQIEEKAMADLLLHYQAADRFDDRITVERVATETATPVWTKTS